MQVAATPAFGPPTSRLDGADPNAAGQQDAQQQDSAADGGSSLASLRYRAGIDSTMVSAKLADATQAHAQAQAQQTGRDTLSLSKGVAQTPDPANPHKTSDPETAQAQKRQQADQQRRIADINQNIKDLQALQKTLQQQEPKKAAQPQTPGETTAKATPQQPDKSNSQPTPPNSEQQQGWWKSWGSTATHGVLGAASFVPGVSVISGAVDAGIYAAEGDYLNAGLSAASMIPGGKEVVTAGKVLVKGAKVVKEAEQAGEAVRAAKLAEEAAKLKKTETLAEGAAANTAAKPVNSATDLAAAKEIGGTINIVPHGFANAKAFSEFGKTLHTGLTEARYTNAQGIMQGSAVTGVSFKTGIPFGRLSDFDVALVGDKSLFQAAKDAGISLRSAGTRTGPLNARDLQKLGLRNLSTKLSDQFGRPVHFMIYEKAESAIQRGASVLIPRQ